MSSASKVSTKRPWLLFWVTVFFFLIYTGIHIILNLTNNGSTEWQSAELGSEEFWSEISGPITIGLCTSLLILSFGMFLHNGQRGISLASPGSFFNAFMIFAVGITVVQISGHAEIFVNACGLEETSCTVSQEMKLVSVTSYLLTWPVLVWLESFYRRIYSGLQDQLPLEEAGHIGELEFLVWLSNVSIVLTLTKVVFSFVVESPETKAAISLLILLEEAVLAAIVLKHYFWPANSRR